VNVSKTPAQFAHSSFLAASKSLRFLQIQRTNPSNCCYYQIHSQQERKSVEILFEISVPRAIISNPFSNNNNKKKTNKDNKQRIKEEEEEQQQSKCGGNNNKSK
jgi:hypothetical protein